VAAAGFDRGSSCTVVGRADQSATSRRSARVPYGTLTSLDLYFGLRFFLLSVVL